MKRIEREPVEIIIRRSAYGVGFSIDWTGIGSEELRNAAANVAGLKTVVRECYDLLESQENERAKLVQGLESVVKTPGLPDIVLAPVREELARWEVYSDAPAATAE